MFNTITKIARISLFGFEKLLFELRCPVCREIQRSWLDDPLCRDCRERILAWPTEKGCRLCGNLIAQGQELCAACAISPPPVRGFLAFGGYDEEIRDLIKAYKYGQIRRLAPFMAELMGFRYRLHADRIQPDAVVIVPRYKPSLSKFYPMREIAAEFCRMNRLRFLKNALIKSRHTLPQAALTGKARTRNLKGAFRVNPHVRLDGLNLLLLDDVSTTGSTIRNVADALHGSGADVWALVIAKAR